ncbi:MAG TPA: DUF192 domain-containing protein [Polyangiales bacterium]|jgi:hypothetical protein
MPRRISRSFALVALLFFAACRATAGGEAHADTTKSAARAAAQVARVILSAPGREDVTVAVEVAQTSAERQQGLMYRKDLDPNAGMLFLFERPQQLTFWMHNTLLPLDMLFITSDWHVLGVVENATPLTDSSRSVPGMSQYVLEVNAGFARRHALGAGTSVRYVPATP